MRIFVKEIKNEIKYTHSCDLSDSYNKDRDFIITRKKVAKIKGYWA